MEKMEVETNELDSNIGLKLPEIPTEEPLYISLCSDSDQFISCDQLYYLIQKNVRFFIIDTRPKAHYKRSSMILPEKCINISQSVIKKELQGYTWVLTWVFCRLQGFHFIKCVAKDIDIRDTDIEILVLLDWNATQETLAQCVYVKRLKEIFEIWNPDIKHNKIKILNGGYKEWLERFPAFTTNCDIQISNINNIDVKMDHGDNKSAISRHIKSNISPNKLNGQRLDPESPESPVLYPKKRRLIDRSSKPITVKTCEPPCKKVKRFMKELNELAKLKEKLANELFYQEYQLYSQREDKYSASDENYLRADINSYSSPNLLQHPGIIGLKNLGNSCYMNSIIQCLSNTTNLAKYFTDNSYIDDLNTNNDNMLQGHVVKEVARVIKALWRGQHKSISPHDLKVAVGQYKLEFESYEQQDSHEFLTFLLDWMHNDLKKEANIPIEMTNAEKEWDKAMNSQRSIISDLFFGQLRSTITCSSCKQASTTYETFNSLTMSLSQPKRCSLNDCMEEFVTGQKVSGWKCPKCQIQRDATKKFDFVKLPPIVVIHLNRFSDYGGWLEKRSTAVDFPLTGFNLKPYLVMENTIRNYNYSLYAVSNHYGMDGVMDGWNGGHYKAICKNATLNQWYKYDDETVTEVSPSQVKSENMSPYLLFYTSFPNTIM